MRRISIFIAAIICFSVAANAAVTNPPVACRGKPKAPFVVVSVANPNEYCRSLGAKAPFFKIILGCAVKNWPHVTEDKRRRVIVWLIVTPPKNSMWYRKVLAHEYGHVNCPHWDG